MLLALDLVKTPFSSVSASLCSVTLRDHRLVGRLDLRLVFRAMTLP